VRTTTTHVRSDYGRDENALVIASCAEKCLTTPAATSVDRTKGTKEPYPVESQPGHGLRIE
jgi:hypothetical protein